MSWDVGGPDSRGRYVGYGVPAYCDHPKCNAEIDRGLAYVCCGEEPYGGDHGCGLYFCSDHADWKGRCERCSAKKARGELPPPFDPKPEHPRWIKHLLTDPSWAKWRAENPARVKAIKEAA